MIIQGASSGLHPAVITYDAPSRSATIDPIVSVDVIGNPNGSIFDSLMTATQGNFVKVFSWYDNEWGFSNRMVDMIKMML